MMSNDDSPLLPGMPDYNERVKKTTAELSLTYDGGVAERHVIPVEDYAPSLLALGTSLSTAHQALQPGTPAPSINISAERPGSFDAFLIVDVNTIIEQGTAILSGTKATATVNAIALLAVVREAIAAVMKIAGRRAEKSQTMNGEVVLTLPDGATLSVSDDALKLIENPKFRKNLRKLFLPLKGGEITSMSIAGQDRTGNSIDPLTATTIDSDSFDYEDDDEPEEWAEDMELTVVSPVFHRGPAWKFDSKRGPVTAKIIDDDFMDKVEKKLVKFGNGDTILAVVVSTQYVDKLDQVKTKHVVSKVLNILGPTQGELQYNG